MLIEPKILIKGSFEPKLTMKDFRIFSVCAPQLSEWIRFAPPTLVTYFSIVVYSVMAHILSLGGITYWGAKTEKMRTMVQILDLLCFGSQCFFTPP